MQGRPADREPPTRAEPGRARADSRPDPEAPPRVAGYSILRQLGKGGMGVVWEAFEHRLERKVALKVHSGRATPERVAALWSEAKLAARIAHPGVVSVHDVGTTQGGRPYYTMDLVEGSSLRTALQDGPLSPARALAIGIEVASAVAAAHEAGIVHCDLKPSNILLDPKGRVKILDFGIAQRLDDQRDRADVRGSPPYMAPEQFGPEPPTVAGDIYAIGVILYEMIAGQRPFEAPSFDELLLAVLQDAPPPLSLHCPLVHVDIERVCLRCLEKHPERRFPSAFALREALLAVLAGSPLPEDASSDRSYVPRSSALPAQRASALLAAREQGTLHLSFRFAFDAPPERVWPFVADNDRMARAIGRRPAAYALKETEGGRLVRTGTMESPGGGLRWEEDPYAWVQNRELSTFRSYPEGPFAASWTELTLRPEGDGRTELLQQIWILPRGPLGRLISWTQIKITIPRCLGHHYRRIAARIAAASSSLAALDPPHRPSPAARARVQKGAALLTRDRSFPDKLVAELTCLLLYAPDTDVERLRPFALADAWGARRKEVLDLFLHAGSCGLVDVAWDLICAECRLPYETVTELPKVAQAGVCLGCGAAYDGDLASSVELVFSPHPSIRKTRFATYCVQSPMRRPHILAQQVLQAGERRTIEVELRAGTYRLVATRAARAWDFAASAVGVPRACALRLTDDALEAQLLAVRAGKVAIELENSARREEVFRLEATGESAGRVTAAAALCHPSFRAFFSGKLVAHGEHLAVSRMAFLFVAVEGRARLFAENGDAGALRILAALDAEVRAAAEAQQGSVVQADTARGLLVAAFAEGALAIHAALDLSARLRAEGQRAAARIAAHQGSCIVLSRDGRVQYFGETIERGAAMLAEAPRASVLVSPELARDPDAARAILDADVDRVIAVAPSARPGGAG